MERRNWTLLVIAAAKGQSLEPVQLQKALFLIGRELDPADRHCQHFYKFLAYDYGPFSADVYTDAAELEREGLVAILGQPARYRRYSVTEAGVRRAGEIRKQLSPDAQRYLDKVVTWVRSLSFDELVRAIYKAYPEMAANSVFRR